MLTDTQKAQIRLYLGYPDAWRYKHTRLESVLDDLSPEAETQITTLLTNLETVETQILNVALPNGGVKRVDEIWFFEAGSVRMQAQATGRMFVGRLSIITGVPIYSDVFGKGGYLGDSFSAGFGIPGSGNDIPLG